MLSCLCSLGATLVLTCTTTRNEEVPVATMMATLMDETTMMGDSDGAADMYADNGDDAGCFDVDETIGGTNAVVMRLLTVMTMATKTWRWYLQ
jgi:hypothetical protein